MALKTYGLAQFVADLRRIAAETKDAGEIVTRVRPLARELALAESWLEARHYEYDAEAGYGVHLLHEEPDHTLAVFAVAWGAGRAVQPHNHGTWAVVAGVDGPEKNFFWKRVDDRSRQGYGEIRKQAEKVFGPGDVVTFLPDSIHSVANETDRTTLSLHVYGKHPNYTGRSQFDPERNVEQPFAFKEA